ncbi:MAG: SUMF1/EgtB/PvdO family nonheme iron enzyme [Thermoguttaceae bacterium]
MRLSTSLLAVALFVSAANVALGGDHAPWPSDWNNWNDPALWAAVGNPGNAGEQSRALYSDTTYYGGVAYNYQIGKYEVTAGQYTAFLNAVAATDTYGLYNYAMGSHGTQGCNIQRSGVSGSYKYTVADDYANRPVNYVSWGDAARFCNWLGNGQLTGAQDASTTEDGSYYINGATSNTALMAVTRKTSATFVIPTENEWYKAAYYKGSGTSAGYWVYPTKTTTAPGRDMSELTNPGNNANSGGSPYPIDSGAYYTTNVGEFQLSASPYGTFDQGGNVAEWNETAWGPYSCGIRGGDFAEDVVNLGTSYRYSQFPTDERSETGFRVAYVPEPGSLTLLVCGAIAFLIWRQRRKENLRL